MAHECPECYQHCRCGGDIDDCEFQGTLEQMYCTHCDDSDDDDFDPMDEELNPPYFNPATEQKAGK